MFTTMTWSINFVQCNIIFIRITNIILLFVSVQYYIWPHTYQSLLTRALSWFWIQRHAVSQSICILTWGWAVLKKYQIKILEKQEIFWPDFIIIICFLKLLLKHNTLYCGSKDSWMKNIKPSSKSSYVIASLRPLSLILSKESVCFQSS